MMKSSSIVVNLTLLLVALIWGVGFVPQRVGLETFNPIAFNAWRFGLGAITLIPIMFYFRIKREALLNLKALMAGVFLGLLLCAGAGFQQVSLGFTKVANVAFITGFYVIFVPVIGLFMKHRYSLMTWTGGGMALFGLALLSGFQGEIAFKGDGLALMGAFFWALHLLAITAVVKRYNQFVLAFYQFVFCAIFSLAGALMVEATIFATEPEGYFWALLSGVVVVGVAYTLQIVALKYSDPFVASVILALESVFGAVAGYLFFEEVLGLYGLMGALLMLVGCLLAQAPEVTSTKSNAVE